MEQLRHDLNSASELEKESIYSRHHEEMDALRRVLDERETRLTKLTSELADAIAAVGEKGHGLEEVESKVRQLEEERREIKEKEEAARREVEQLKVIRIQLIVTDTVVHMAFGMVGGRSHWRG